MTDWVLGVIGGSGLYEIDGLEDRRWIDVAGPWGAPSDQLLTGRIGGVKLVFLPRHGRGHRIPPSGLNARANIDALKRAGCTDILSISAVGSLREELDPGTFVVVDQYIDRTVGRVSSFFGEGCVAHVSVADPVCAQASRPRRRSGTGRRGAADAGRDLPGHGGALSSPPAPKAPSIASGAAT